MSHFLTVKSLWDRFSAAIVGHCDVTNTGCHCVTDVCNMSLNMNFVKASPVVSDAAKILITEPVSLD